METPKEKLKKLTAWTTVPTLSDTEIDELLLQSGVADAEGQAPESTGWVPSYDLNSAAAAGWLIKAGRAANTTETAPDSIEVASRIFENCLRMARVYGGKRAVSVTISPVANSG